MSVIDSIVQIAKPWADFYGHYKPVSAAVTYLHISGIMVGGGLAIASDRAGLRALSGSTDDRARVLKDFSTVHRPVITALAVVVASGLAMMLSDADTFLKSPVYYLKLTMFVLLLVNGWFVQRNERRLALDPSPTNALWRWFKFGAIASIALWLTTAMVGAWLTII